MAKANRYYPHKTPEEKADSYIKEITDFFIEAIKTNQAPWQKPWKPSGNPYPHNPETGTVYQGLNHLYLTLAQELLYKSTDSRWYTYLGAKSAGGFVKKGSRACTIRKPVEIPLDENGKFIPKEKRGDITPSKHIISFHYDHVFHASQIDGLAPEIAPPLDKPKVIESAQTILDDSKAIIIHDQKDSSFYRPSTDEIHLLPAQYYNTPEDYYCTALHELSHWTGHPSRLNRDLESINTIEGRAMEELRAEIGAYMICKGISLNFNPQNTVSYVQSWYDAIKNDPNSILKATTDAMKIMDYCLSFPNSKEHNVFVKLNAERNDYSSARSM
jgi:putative DNA primase/helicase